MKKKYIEPNSRVIVLKSMGLIAGSGKGVYGSLTSSGGGDSQAILDYGGIDENGDLDPE